MRQAAVLIAVLVGPALAGAHEFWVERNQDSFVAQHGHRGGVLLPIDRAEVKAIRCVGESGASAEVVRTARFEPKEVRWGGACSVASVFKDGGTWSLTPDGEVRLPKNKAENAVKSWASRQYAKWVDARSPRAGTVLGDELELVPLTDLAKAREGDKIALRVLSAGQPVPNAAVAVDHRPIGETDSKGEVRLRLRSSGVESISASIRRQHPTPEADADVLEASLTFEVRR